MIQEYENLVELFVKHPIDVLGVYKTRLSPNGIYKGHSDQPTTKCGFLLGIQGEASLLCNGKKKIKMIPGKVLLGGFNMRLEMEAGDRGFAYYLIHYLPSPSNKDREKMLHQDPILFEPGIDAYMIELIDELLQKTKLHKSIEKLEKKILFLQLLHLTITADSDSHLQEENEIITSAYRYIQQYYMKSLTLEKLAARYNLNAKYFSYLFQRHMGISPIAYLIQYRMSKAYKMLIQTSDSISDIALRIGYTDAYYFSRLFKKYHGMTPTETRKKVQSDLKK